MLDFVATPDIPSRTICAVLNCCVVLRHPAKTAVLSACCEGVPDHRGRLETGHACSRCERELKPISSVVVPQRGFNVNTSGVIWGEGGAPLSPQRMHTPAG